MAIQVGQAAVAATLGGGFAMAAPVIAVGLTAMGSCWALSIPCFTAYDKYVSCVDKRSWYNPICLPLFVATAGSCTGMGASCMASGGVLLKFMSTQDVNKMKKILDVTGWLSKSDYADIKPTI